MLKNHKPFFINIGNFRDISVQTRQLFSHFRPVKFCSRDRVPPISILHKAIIITHIAPKFQLCTSNGFGIICELITSSQNLLFFCFLCLNSRSRDIRIPKIGTRDAFINFYVKSKFQLSRLYGLCVIKQINPRMPKFANKNKDTTRSLEVPISHFSLTSVLPFCQQCDRKLAFGKLAYIYSKSAIFTV